MPAIRVRTPTGWQDVSSQTPPAAPATVAIEAWRTVGAAGEPAYGTGWAAYHPTYPVQFRKRPDGVVELRGLVRGGAAGTTIFNLPAGYWPVGTADVPFIERLYDGSAFGQGHIYVQSSNGAVILANGTVTAAGAWISITASFSTDQATFPTGPQGPAGPVGTPSFVTALPASPVDGQECYYIVSAYSCAWHLKYRAAEIGAYKWYVVGGAPIHSITAPTESTTSTSYVDLTTIGPDLTIPLAGVYLIGVGAGAANTDGVSEAYMSYAIGGAVASDNEVMKGNGWTTASRRVSLSNERLRTITAASTVLRAKYRTGGGTGVYEDRWLRATPVRVG